MKKYAGILLVLSLLLSLFLIQDSLAKYITENNSQATMQIARWKIVVNNHDIRENNITNIEITPVFPGTSSIKPGIIAPTAEGYFDLVIDTREVDVNFTYRMQVEVAPDSSVSDLITTGYSLNGSTIQPWNGVTPLETNMYYTSNNEILNYRIYIKWDDSASQSMDNEADTQATASEDKPKMLVKLNFIQKVN